MQKEPWNDLIGRLYSKRQLQASTLIRQLANEDAEFRAMHDSYIVTADQE